MSKSEGRTKVVSGEAKSDLPSPSPDFYEENYPDEIDNIVPTRGYQMTPMVALGGSAGSIAALQTFFKAMPTDSGMVFVVILHLSPSHESGLADLLGRSTTMPVVQAQDGQKVEANHVYVIPPGKHLATVDGHLQLNPMQPEFGRRVAIDLFLRSLADTHGPHAAAIILSGADGDGSIGIKRIKERGGLTIAQDVDEAEMPSMPRSAIDTGMIDWVLQVGLMPARLLSYINHEKSLRLPPEEGPQPSQPEQPAKSSQDQAEAALRELLIYLRTRTGHDFSYYKRATILRRIARRMQVNAVDDLPAYLAYLRTHPGESGALLQDMLISVTNFFRDRDAFAALEALIPRLFENKHQTDVVRVWVPACATGEEAYSVAMLLLEHAATLEAPPVLQVFACDLDEKAIARARAGVFPEAISADVSEERLRRFFAKGTQGYRVARELREMVLFALHDLVKDAPFSRMDLIACRNLLIYLNREAQKRVMDTFHFALRPEGLLFLGSSESVEDGNALFAVVDKKNRIFSRLPAVRGTMPLPWGSSLLLRAVETQERGSVPPMVHGPRFAREASAGFPMPPGPAMDQAFLSELHLKLIERLAPPSAVVNGAYEIVHLSGQAGRFLKLAGGEPTANLLRLAHPMLRIELRAALFRAAETKAAVETFAIPIEMEGQSHLLDLRVSPADEISPGFFLVVFELREPGAGAAPAKSAASASSAEPIVTHLERELEQVKGQLRNTVEQYEAGSEEMKASNEELQAMNEELRSATEELETSREELQSINEELTAVNSEMKNKVEELANANSDLQNLMAATSIATIFLDREMAITRYTPSAVELFHLIPTDLGRPLEHLKHKLEYPELLADAGKVLRTLVPVEREVKEEHRWFLARLRPYRTQEDHIAGVVLTFVDITERKETEQAIARDLDATNMLRELGEKLTAEDDTQLLFDAIVATAISLMCADAGDVHLIDPKNRELVLLASRGIPKEMEERFAGGDAIPGSPPRTVLSTGKRVIVDFDAPGVPDPDGLRRLHLEAGLRSAQATPLVSRRGRLVGVLSTHWKERHRPGERDLRFMDLLSRLAGDAIERRQSEEALRESEQRLQLIVENAREYAIFTTDLERRVTSWNSGAERMLGWSGAEVLGRPADVIFTPEDQHDGVPGREAHAALTEGRAVDERWHVRKDGSRFWGSGVMMAMRDQTGMAVGLVKIFRDQTEERQAREALERSQAELWEALQENEHARAAAEVARVAKDHFLAVLSHELRTPLTPVLMGVQMLAWRGDLPPDVNEALEMIERNVRLEARFIDDLLDVTRIERGKLELQMETTDLHEAIRKAVEISTPDIEEKKQKLSVALDAPRCELQGDAVRLQQVFWNLLKNASKFTPAGGSIDLRTKNNDGQIVVAVSDSGIGFGPEATGRIFDAFLQANASVTQHFGGLGLGLAIAKATVHGHGGKLLAESAGENKGATFTVELPLSEPKSVTR